VARSCTICTHPDKTAIETAIVANEKYQEISKRFDISISAIGRHKDNHLKAAIQAVQSKRAEQTAEIVEEAEQKQEHFVWNLFDEMKWLHEQVHVLYQLAKTEGDVGTSLKALSEARQQTKLFSELLVGQEPGQAEKLEAEWLLIREAIFTALEPYPDARLAVARALLALRNRDDYQSDRQLLQAESPDSVS
jgi:hypothetical protein